MPLQRQKVAVPFLGLDTKTDVKRVVPGKLLAATNARFDKFGQISKRYGYAELTDGIRIMTTRTTEATELGEDAKQALYGRGDTLLRMDRAIASAWSPSSDAWWTTEGEGDAEYGTFTGAAQPIALRTQRMGASNVGLTNPNACVVGNIAFVLTPSVSGTGIDYSISDVDNGAVIAHNKFLSVNPRFQTMPYTEAGGDQAMLLVAGNGTALALRAAKVASDAVGGIDSIATVDGTVHADLIFDICPLTYSGTPCFAIAYKDAAGTLNIRVYSLDVSTGTETLETSVALAVTISNALCVVPYDDGLLVCYQDGGTSTIDCAQFDSALAHVGTFQIDNDTTTLEAITGTDDASGEAALIFAEHDSGGIRKTTMCGVRGSTAAIHDRVSWTPGLSLASKAFYVDLDQPDRPAGVDPQRYGFVWALRLDTVQATYFLMRTELPVAAGDDPSSVCVGKLLQERAADALPTDNMIACVSSVGDKFYHGFLRQDRLQNISSVVLSAGYCETDMAPGVLPSAVLGSELFVASAVTMALSDAPEEVGFHTYPEISIAGSATGGQLSDGAYGVKCIFEATDRNGNLVRSAPSPAQTITLAAGGAIQSITVTVLDIAETLRTLRAAETVKDIRLVIFRTALGGSVYYRDTEGYAHAYYSDTAGFSRTVAGGTVTDATLLTQELLYTESGEAENVAPPPGAAICKSGDRLLVAAADDAGAIWYSKPARDGVAVSFARELVYRLSSGEEILAMRDMDGGPIVFTREAVVRLLGSPGDIFGSGNYNAEAVVPSASGLISRNALLSMPTGILFKSRSGWFLLGRDLTCRYVGAPVDAYDDNAVLDAALMEDAHEARFLLDSGLMLVWNYTHEQWSVHEFNLAGAVEPVTCAVADGAFFTAAAAKTVEVLQEDSTLFYDGASAQIVSMALETAWIKLSGLQGFQRVYWVYLLGDYKSAHTLTVKVYYDYVETVAETVAVALTSDPGPYLHRFKPGKQKCMAIRFDIEDSGQAGTYESFSLTELMLEIGAKRGAFKPPAAQTL